MMAETETQKLYLLQSSPHIARPDTVPRIMSRVIVALLPVTAFGIVQFGIAALLNVAVAVASAVVAEALFRRVTGQEVRLRDCSAVVSGLLLALVIPPSTPLWMTALGSVFAIVVGKEFFGGLGANVFNPALVGRAFLLMSFPAALTTWLKPAAPGSLFRPDGTTGPTPLAVLHNAAYAGSASAASGAADAATQASGAAQAGVNLAGAFDKGSALDVYKELFFGAHGGCIGETSILLILAGALFLLVTRTIDWRAPAGMLGAAALMSVIFGVDPVFTLLSGGLMFGAVFMATDYTSAPVTETGKLIFGIGAGIIVVLVRQLGSYPEGVMFSILIMNALTPFLNRLLHKKYGYVAPKKPAAGAAGGKK
jgi:electron transport complex protein RnfD